MGIFDKAIQRQGCDPTENIWQPLIIMLGEDQISGTALISDLALTNTYLKDVYIWNDYEFVHTQMGVNNKGTSALTHSLEAGLDASEWKGKTRHVTGKLFIIKDGRTSAPISTHISGGAYYDDLWDNITKAIAGIIHDGKTPLVSVVHWRGEADHAVSINADAYPGRWETWEDDLRARLGDYIPVIAPGIAPTNASYPLADQCNTFLSGWHDPGRYRYYIDMSAQSLNADLVHFESDAHVYLGGAISSAITNVFDLGTIA